MISEKLFLIVEDKQSTIIRRWLIISDSLLHHVVNCYGYHLAVLGQIVSTNWGKTLSSLEIGSGNFRGMELNEYTDIEKLFQLLTLVSPPMQSLVHAPRLRLNERISEL